MDISVNELSFHVVDEGLGPAVLLLHGFPDSSALWRYQIGPLVDSGRRVIAPDLRGFGASARPIDVGAYTVPALLGDVLGILDALGVEQADVVGHDWGAALGWALAGAAPQRVRRLVALSVGHPAGYFTDAIRQRELFWCMLFSCPRAWPSRHFRATIGRCCAPGSPGRVATWTVMSPTWPGQGRSPPR
jgi:pimeloyl-ACP methyl ester carboxylesterase